MSLFSSIRMAGNALQVNDIALQVVGQNIANANTPGYIREDVTLATAGTQRIGDLLLGMGVQVEAVVQKIDKYLQQRLYSAISDDASSQTLKNYYTQLENLTGALSDNSLGAALNDFFNSISDILNQPDEVTVRNAVVSQGDTLTYNITSLYQNVENLCSEINDRIQTMAADINRLTDTIADLNVKISSAEGGSVSKSEAVGLRDQRYTALEDLAQLISVKSVEQSDGSVTVYCSDNTLVDKGTARAVEATLDGAGLSNDIEIHLTDNNAKLNPDGGELCGLLDSRDEILGGFLQSLNEFAGTLAYEFNKVYSSGQGLSGYSSLTSENAVDDADHALNVAGLPFTPETGSFQVLVHNTTTGLTSTTNININLQGAKSDTTLNDLKTAISGIAGLSAEITDDGHLQIESQAADAEFSFANDTSGVLAALGLNIFFSGSTAGNIGLSAQVVDDPGKFAASSGGIGADTDNATVLAGFLSQPLQSCNGETLNDLYTGLIDNVTEGSARAQATATATQSFEDSLDSQKKSISGVSLDEEAVKLIQYQRAYQASARYISILSELFDVLVNI